MNPNNYATLEASNRLVDAGIVLKTEAMWIPALNGDELLLVHCSTDLMRAFAQERSGSLPAPMFTEVWRELPPGTELHKAHSFTEAFNFADTENADSIYPPCNSPDNPTDALIDLLIWVRKEASND